MIILQGEKIYIGFVAVFSVALKRLCGLREN